MPLLTRLCLFAILTFCFMHPIRAADFVVAPNGDDSNPGTAERPFATITRAREALRAKIAAGLTADVEVLIRGGTYHVTESIRFGVADGGTETHRVTYAAWPDEQPAISGGRVLRNWQVQDDGSWKTTLPEVKAGKWSFRQLYVDGRRATRARHPNAGYFHVEQVGEDRRTNFRYKPGDLRAYERPEQIELVFLHDWSVTRVPLKSIDEASRTLTVQHQVGGPSRWAVMNWFEPHPRYFLENSREFLDAPGEWHLDRSSGTLIYRPLAGQRPESTEVVAPVAHQLLVAQGDIEEDQPVRNLHFVGIGLEHAAWKPNGGVYWGRQACTFWNPSSLVAGAPPHFEADPAAVQFDLAEQCSFVDGRVARVGGCGLWIGRGCRRMRVTGCVIADAGGNGIMVGEGQVRKIAGTPWWQAAPQQAAADNEVSNNVVERCGRELFGAVGIWVGLAAGTTIAHNEVRDHPYTGISVGWMWWNPRDRPRPRVTPCERTQVLKNHIHRCMLVLSDGGCIYVLGDQPNSVIRGNLLHGVPPNAGRAESNGMFLDQGTGSFVIEENVVYNVGRSPLRFHKGWENVVRNNVLEVQSGVPTVRYNDTLQTRIRLENNRVVERVEPETIEVAGRTAGLEETYRLRLLLP